MRACACCLDRQGGLLSKRTATAIGREAGGAGLVDHVSGLRGESGSAGY